MRRSTACSDAFIATRTICCASSSGRKFPSTQGECQAFVRTNASENDIRAFVTKRKISGGTVSDKGRDARDTMLRLAKTCMKLNLSFYHYIGARLGIVGPTIPPLASLIPQASA